VPDLKFQVEEVGPVAGAATPNLEFKLRISNTTGEAIQSIALRCQVQIEPVRRRYTPAEQERLRELFGEPERWSQTLRSLQWVHLNLNVPGFDGDTVLSLVVPCTFDFNVAMTKYAYGLDDGELPTTLLFSGTVFYAGNSGLQIAQIPWDREASFRVPVRTWKKLMDDYFPHAAWLALRRDVFDKLYAYKVHTGLATWEEAIERILGSTAEVKP
jgi:Family of unknown function (DUF6084)